MGNLCGPVCSEFGMGNYRSITKFRSKMAKYILFLVLVFTLMAIVEINGQDLNEHFQNLGDQIDNLGDSLTKLGIDGSGQINEEINKAKSKLGINSSASLSFSFAAMLMSLFYVYIVA